MQKDSLEDLALGLVGFEKLKRAILYLFLFSALLGGLIGLGIRTYNYFQNFDFTPLWSRF
jgi:hypothetical protein